jgi:hypothetical protein
MMLNGAWSFFGSPIGLAVTLSAAAAGVYLLLTHTGHLLFALPYLILLLCPLLHVFGHRHGHGHSREHRHD